MDKKQIDFLLKRGYPKSVIEEASRFLLDNEASLFNLALLGASEYRIMYRDKTGKVEAKIFNIKE